MSRADSDICSEIEELIPAVALGMADPEDEAMVLSRLDRCPGAAAALAGYRELSEAMLYTAPPVQPPAQLTARLVNALAESVSESKDVAPEPEPREGRWASLVRQRPWLPGAVAAAALILLLVAANGYWLAQNQRMETQLNSLVGQMSDQEAALLTEEDLIEIEIGVEGTIEQGQGETGQESEQQTIASVVWSPVFDVVILYAKAFPPLEGDSSYQGWLTRDGERDSMGLFDVNAVGDGALIFRTNFPLDSFDLMGITVEPATGSPGPTTSPIVRGEL